MNIPPWVARGVRAAMAIAIVAALIEQYTYSRAHASFPVLNFFGYFTVLSNISAAAVLAALAVRPALEQIRAMSVVRGGPTLYMTVTGLVYWVVLKPNATDVATNVVWVDVVVHQIGPVVVLADWLARRPAHALTRREAATWLVFPVVYVTYTMVRGAVVDWYPYPFLDPRETGTAAIAGMVGAIVAVAIGVSEGLRRWTGPRPTRG